MAHQPNDTQSIASLLGFFLADLPLQVAIEQASAYVSKTGPFRRSHFYELCNQLKVMQSCGHCFLSIGSGKGPAWETTLP